MRHLRKLFSVLVAAAYLALSALCVAGPRVVCFALDRSVSVIDATGACCQEERQCPIPADGFEVVVASVTSCDLCVDLKLPQAGDQVRDRSNSLPDAFPVHLPFESFLAALLGEKLAPSLPRCDRLGGPPSPAALRTILLC